MAQNDFKSFATGIGANVTSQADWEVLAALATGFQSGKASSAQINKAIRQASFIAAALAQYTSDKTGGDVLDDGDQAAFITKMTAAFGEDFQPLDATLTALAGLTGAADKLAYFNGADTAALTVLTAFAREILAQTDATGVLSKLGLGNMKYGAPLIGKLIEWPLQQMPQEIWTDCGMVFIPYMAQTFDGTLYPLLAQLHPSLKLPADMRGQFARGYDNGAGVDAGRALLSTQGDAMRNFAGTFGNLKPTGGATNVTGPFSVQTTTGGSDSSSGSGPSIIKFDPSTVVPTASENRPTNVAWNFIVRAK